MSITTATTDSVAAALQTNAVKADARDAPAAATEIDRCLEELSRLAQSELSPEEFYAALLDRALRLLPAAGGAVWQVASGRAELTTELICHLRFPLPLTNCQRAAVLDRGPFYLPAQARTADRYPCDYPYPWPLIVCPIVAEQRACAVVEIALDRDVNADVLAGATQLVGILGEIAGDFHRRRELLRLRQRDSRRAQFADIIERFHAGLEPIATAYTIANDGQRWIGCDRVSVLRLRGGRAKTLAVSAVDRLDRRSEQVAALEAVATAVAVSRETLAWQGSASDHLPPQLSRVLETYLDVGHARQLTAYLLHPAPPDSQLAALPAIGVLVAECFAEGRSLPMLRGRGEEVARIAGPALANALKHQALPLRTVQEWLAQGLERLASRPLAAALAVLALVAVSVLLAVVPADFSMPVQGTLQHQVRRNLFAPADGVVAEVHAEHGERVSAGEVLLRIRNPSLDLEQGRLSGELPTAQAKLDAVRATRLRPEHSPTSGDQDRLASEEEQLQQQIRGLEAQLEVLGQLRGELDVTSPLTGIVLTWNTRELLANRPVKQGQSLLTVADPTGPWVLELRVKDAQLGHVLAGQRTGSASLPVTYLLATDPALTRHGHLQSVALAADVVEGESAAEAIATLAGPVPEGTRAGSHVTARIHCGRRSIGYVWLHDVIDFVRTSLLF